MDTLRKIALDWAHGDISDAEARRRENLLPPTIHHRDTDPYDGDGGWDEGPVDNRVTTIEAMKFTGELTREQVREFLRVISNNQCQSGNRFANSL